MSISIVVENDENGKIVVVLENSENDRGRFRVRDDFKNKEEARKFADDMQRAINKDQAQD